MTVNKITIKLLKKSNILVFKYLDHEWEIDIDREDEINSFDDLFDFIIDNLSCSNDVEIVLDREDDFNSDSRINEISKGLVEIINKEIKEILNEINSVNLK